MKKSAIPATFEDMQGAADSKAALAYKWLSYCIVFAFLYYWLFTLAMLFFPKTVRTVSPRQAGIYGSFARQNWRLFSVTKFYNRELLFITRDRNDAARADTIDLVAYTVAQKKAHAPFNNYQDAIDHIIYQVMNGLEWQMIAAQKKVRGQFPALSDSVYLLKASQAVEADSGRGQHLRNLVNYGRYVARRQGKEVAGREYRLINLHRFIAPQKPKWSFAADSLAEPVFISSYKPLPLR